MPYTSYVAVLSYAAIYLSPEAAWLTGGLVLNEVLNAGIKWVLRKLAPESSMLRRPDGAIDSGIYPQHYPRPSTTSGMPSGHSQTSCFLAVVLTGAVIDDDPRAEGFVLTPKTCVAVAYVW